MLGSPRDRISVDLRGLRAVVHERARVLGVSPSELVRRVLAESLGTEKPSMSTCSPSTCVHDGGPVRLSVRMARRDVEATRAAAKRAGLPCGSYLASLVAGIPALLEGCALHEYLAALALSNAEMAALGRDLRHLTNLLRHGSVRAAHEYRERLDEVGEEVRRHLQLVSGALVALQPRSSRTPASERERSQP